MDPGTSNTNPFVQKNGFHKLFDSMVLKPQKRSKSSGVVAAHLLKNEAPAPKLVKFNRSHKSLEKHSVSRLSYLFAHLHLLSSYSFSSTLLSSNCPLLSASSLLCFSSVHIVGSLTSKLPSIIKGSWEAILPSYEWLLLDAIDYDEGWSITEQYII